MQTDNTYRIKPLVWLQDTSEHTARTDFATVVVQDNGCWYLYVGNSHGADDWFENAGSCDSVEDAKACAESAYRTLLTEALEEVV